MDLVGRHGEEVRSFGDCHAPQCLDGIAQHQRADGVRSSRDLGDRLHDADLVIDQHDGDHCHLFVELPLEQVETEQAVAADRENGQIHAPARPATHSYRALLRARWRR